VSPAGEGTGGRLEGVLFDYGETLVSFVPPEAALAAAAERIVALLDGLGRCPPDAGTLRATVFDRVERQVQEHDRRDSLAEIDVLEASRRAYRDAGLDLDPDLLDEVIRLEQEAWWQGARVDPETVPLLDGLRRHGVRVGLCSNAPYRLRSLRDQLAHLGLDRHLDAVTFSAEVGWRKPSPHIFTAALRALGTGASSTVMVGDSEWGDIEGARGAGMRAVLVHKSGAQVETAADAVVARLSALPDALRTMRLYWD